ncbi:MAG: hypothetical protein NTU89_00485, partial [Candidatus Dependentiae bacterium]|nr:hypothetical protein [Candidatus Dependentiae bacterium]
MHANHKILVFIGLLIIPLISRSELLIVKREHNLFKSLSEKERLKYGEGIAQIFLKYQWPTCIASQLTKEEQDELLTSGVPQAEEIFIQKKIKE